MGRLLFFHDFSSPYCRLALDAVTAAAEEAGLAVRPVPSELRPAPEPLPGPDDPAFAEELRVAMDLAGDWGVALKAPPLVPRTRKAHEAVAYAIHHDAAEAVLRGIYEAFWSRGQDIGRLDVLADIGEAAGLEREALHVALGTDRYEPDVIREEDAVAAAMIPVVPMVQLGDVRAAGLHSADDLARWIEENR